DKELTKKLDKALNLIDIKLLDHIIISPFDEYLSLKDGGIF
ncbi:JAB domain-containing protein, partial [Flavobacterium sp.]